MRIKESELLELRRDVVEWSRQSASAVSGFELSHNLLLDLIDEVLERRSEKPDVQPRQDPLRERLAAYAHEAWSGWMRYLFSRSDHSCAAGSYSIPRDLVDRWTRQVNTPYADLPENEKDSDRKEADKMLAIVSGNGRDER